MQIGQNRMQVKYARLEQGTRRAITKLSNMLRGSWYGSKGDASEPGAGGISLESSFTILYWFIIDLLALD